MHQKFDALNPRLEELLLNKAFGELHPDELQYVNQYLKEEEYQQYRQLLLHSRQLFKTDQPSSIPPISEQLSKALNQKRSPGWAERIGQWAAYRVPLWQAGLAMLLVIAYFHFQAPAPSAPMATAPAEKTHPAESIPAQGPAVSEKPTLTEQQSAPATQPRPVVPQAVDSPLIAYVADSPSDSSSFTSRSFSKDRELMDLRVEMR